MPNIGAGTGTKADAKMLLADEYDAAQERGEVAKQGQRTDLIPEGKKVATPQDIGLRPKDIHEARSIRDAERTDPGIRRGAPPNVRGSSVL